MLLSLPVEQELSDAQLDKFADILITIGQVLFASIVVPSLFGLDKIEPDVIPSGSVLMFGSWIFGLLVVKGAKK